MAYYVAILVNIVCLKIMYILQVVISMILSYLRLETTASVGEWSGAAYKDKSRVAALLLVGRY